MALSGVRVSVIVPTYNRVDFLTQALDSVANQTFKNWECLVCDDGSNDATVALVRARSASDNRFRLIEGARSGLPAAPRNRGIREAKGEWVAFLDDDDLWFPAKLEWQLEVAATQHWDFVASTAVQFHALETDGEDRARSADCERVRTVDPLLEGNPIVNSSVIVKTSAVREVGCLDESWLFRAVEDFDLWTRLHASGIVLGIMTTPALVLYRMGSADSISRAEDVRAPDVVRQDWAQSVILLELWNMKGRPASANCYLANRVAHSGNLSLWIGDVLSWARSLRSVYSIERKIQRLKAVAGTIASVTLAAKPTRIIRAREDTFSGARELSLRALDLTRTSAVHNYVI